jgi:hypothetical protein
MVTRTDLKKSDEDTTRTNVMHAPAVVACMDMPVIIAYRPDKHSTRLSAGISRQRAISTHDTFFGLLLATTAKLCPWSRELYLLYTIKTLTEASSRTRRDHDAGVSSVSDASLRAIRPLTEVDGQPGSRPTSKKGAEEAR